jgi:hypothetical protein
MEEPSIYNRRIELPPISMDDVDSINKGVTLIIEHLVGNSPHNTSVQDIDLENQDTQLSNCKQEELILWKNYITRKLQWIAMQKIWTTSMQEEFLKLDILHGKIKTFIK